MTTLSRTEAPPTLVSATTPPRPTPLATALRLAAERTAVHGLVRGTRQVHRRGGARAFGPDHVHRVVNEGPDPAVSLHVYSPRLQVQHDYANEDGILRRIVTRRAGQDW